MKDLLIQIGIGIIMAILFVVTILAVIVVWIGIVLYSIAEWMVTHDGFGFSNQSPNSVVPPYTKLDAEIDAAFSKKPLPKPYSPTDNPLYQLEKDYAEFKAKLPPFDRETVFAEVDASNVRMSNKTPGQVVTEVTFKEIVRKAKAKGRHNLRGEKGRFVKRIVDTPITRYGVKTSERFGNQ